MKIKKDFITNSSTCCFVLLGWQIENLILKKNQLDFATLRTKGFDVFDGTEGGAVDNKHTLIGVEIVKFDYEDLPDCEMSDLLDVVDKVIELKNEVDLDLGPIQIITTSRMC